MKDPDDLWRILMSESDVDNDPPDPPVSQADCTREHREPQGPNEDIASCTSCWGITFTLRPEGETFGLHADDCSLPVRHEGYCVGGGEGHPPAEHIRGFFGPGTETYIQAARDRWSNK